MHLQNHQATNQEKHSAGFYSYSLISSDLSAETADVHLTNMKAIPNKSTAITGYCVLHVLRYELTSCLAQSNVLVASA